MFDRIHWSIPEHARTSIAHHFYDVGAALRTIAVHLAELAECFSPRFEKRAALVLLCRVIPQVSTGCAEFIGINASLMFHPPAIDTNHQINNLLLLGKVSKLFVCGFLSNCHNRQLYTTFESACAISCRHKGDGSLGAQRDGPFVLLVINNPAMVFT